MELEQKLLDKFYREIYSYLQACGKLKQNSIILSFVKMNSNNRFESLNKSSVNSEFENKNLIESLLKKGFIRKTERLNEYVISALGIYEIEKKNFKEDYVIKHLDKTYFDLFKSSEKPLEVKEKVVLLTLISVRAFSEEASIKFNMEGNVLETIGEIFELCYEKLKELGLTGLNEKGEIYGAFKNEKKVSGIFRRLTDLPKKTKGLYSFKTKGHSYFLDISNKEQIDVKKLAYLFKIIWKDKILNADEINKLYLFLCELSNKYSVYLFESNGRLFSRPYYDGEIKKALYESI